MTVVCVSFNKCLNLKFFSYGLCLWFFLMVFVLLIFLCFGFRSGASPHPELADTNADAGFKCHHQIIFTDDDFVDEALDHIIVVMTDGS